IPPQHWIWANSMHPTEKWGAVLFKKPCRGHLTHRQNIYNHYVSKFSEQVDHAFAALKGQFQSLHEFWHKVATAKDLHVAIYWIYH
ncbi:hypothetical protein M404DRAFT_149494, partial [Pisolithus tinctorius Marx 270]